MGAIVLQFVGNNSFGSTLIEWFDHGQYSHVDSVLPDGTLLGARDDVILGVPAGVQIRPATYVDSYPKIKQVSLPTTDEIAQAYYDFVRSQIGKPYDSTAIAAFIVGRDWINPLAWFCSELATAGLLASRFLLHKPSAPCYKIAPDDLLLICSTFVDI
jgi:hypothetical protein